MFGVWEDDFPFPQVGYVIVPGGYLKLPFLQFPSNKIQADESAAVEPEIQVGRFWSMGWRRLNGDRVVVDLIWLMFGYIVTLLFP